MNPDPGPQWRLAPLRQPLHFAPLPLPDTDSYTLAFTSSCSFALRLGLGPFLNASCLQIKRPARRHVAGPGRSVLCAPRPVATHNSQGPSWPKEKRQTQREPQSHQAPGLVLHPGPSPGPGSYIWRCVAALVLHADACPWRLALAGPTSNLNLRWHGNVPVEPRAWSRADGGAHGEAHGEHRDGAQVEVEVAHGPGAR